MRIILLAAAILAGPALAKPATPAQLENETWRAFKAKNLAEIRPLFSPDFVGIYADGRHDLSRELESLKQVTIQDYTLTPYQTRAVGRDDVLLTYGADVRLLVGTKPLETRIWAASLWQREGGRWLCVYHTEIKAK